MTGRRRVGRPSRPPTRIVRTVLWPTPAQLRHRGPRLVVGLLIIAVGITAMVRSELGLAPYEVLNQGVAVQTPLTIGQASIVIGLAVLLLWFPLRQRPGLGTLLNVVGVGLVLDALLLVTPELTGFVPRVASMLVGVACVGVGIGLYVGAGLGPGPRDGLMTGVASRGVPVWSVRLVLELSALGLGWWLGGTVGPGTLLFAVGVPFLADVSLRYLSVADEPVPPRRR